MSKVKREIPCKYYICKGECEKGKKAEHTKTCQICKTYTPRSRNKKVKGISGKHGKQKYLAGLRAKEKLDEYNND